MGSLIAPDMLECIEVSTYLSDMMCFLDCVDQNDFLVCPSITQSQRGCANVESTGIWYKRKMSVATPIITLGESGAGSEQKNKWPEGLMALLEVISHNL